MRSSTSRPPAVYQGTIPIRASGDAVMGVSTKTGSPADVRKGRCLCGVKTLRSVVGSRKDDDLTLDPPDDRDAVGRAHLADDGPAFLPQVSVRLGCPPARLGDTEGLTGEAHPLDISGGWYRGGKHAAVELG